MNFKNCISLFLSFTSKLTFIPSLLTRIVIGSVFASSGLGKLQHLDKTIDFFQSIGIPLAHIQAPFVGVVELVCGISILLGLAARAAAIPLICVMIAAIWTAKREDVNGIASLFEISEFLYFVLLIWLLVYGAGRISIDYFLWRGHWLKNERSE